MGDNIDLMHIKQHPELDLIEVEKASDHDKLMLAYEKVNHKMDCLIEKKRKSSPPKNP